MKSTSWLPSALILLAAVVSTTDARAIQSQQANRWAGWPAPALQFAPPPTRISGSPDWAEQEVIADDGQAADLYGFDVLVRGDLAFVSAAAPIYRPGKVYVFAKVADAWMQTQVITATQDPSAPPNWSDFFGWSLALSGDRLLVGAPFAFDPMMGPIGAAYVFTNVAGTWTQTSALTATIPTATDYFGWAVTLAGNTAVIGANSHNRGANGTEGAAYVFLDENDAWTQTQLLEGSDSTPGDGHQFGNAIAFDGTTLLIGAPGADYPSTGVYFPGAAYRFGNVGGTWTETARLVPDDSANGDQFGFSLAASADTALIGAPAATIGANSHQGAIYAFDLAGGAGQQVQKLVASDGVALNQFGQSVALAGDTAVVGQWRFDDDPNHPAPEPAPGEAYLFERSAGVWSQAHVFAASDGTPGDSFGWSVDADGTSVLVGAQGNVGANTFQGTAYFYSPQIDDVIFADAFEGTAR